ncbi:hypothetical protein [Paenibacillus koleovorans]|uniref:hypothetical protein n=1 Tax=Paenibacillus koleovorans TaxID=121608 RepID=UPI000FD75B3A|nr:hypothetical protein [Paenibacillus koleovorans]
MRKTRLPAKSLLRFAALYLGLTLTVSILPNTVHGEPPDGTFVSESGSAVTTTVGVPATAIAAATASSELDRQIQAWVDKLSAQTGFDTWSRATWNRFPLGPGLHGWVVLLQENGNEIGYLVVSSASDGSLVLAEYGIGSSPLFSLQTLYRTLVQLALIPDTMSLVAFVAQPGFTLERLYLSSLHAVWRLNADSEESIYVDAKTGEQLPLSKRNIESLKSLTNPSAATEASPSLGLPKLTDGLQPTAAREWPIFDPFHNTYWLTGGSPLNVNNVNDLTLAMDSGPDTAITYRGDLYDRAVLAPFAVTGVVPWNDQSAFVRLEQDGSRYMPLEELKRFGTFHLP